MNSGSPAALVPDPQARIWFGATTPTPWEAPLTPPDLRGLDALLAPDSVAIIGASDDPTRIGGRPVSYLLRAGFAGPVYPVNPNRDTVQGLRAYPSIQAVPEAPDVCVIAVPAAIVPQVLEDCAERGAKAAVILSAGFAEVGEEGRAIQDRLSETARRTGIRVLGPNCIGLFNARTGWMGTFSSALRDALPEPGPISIVSQSGAVGGEILSLLRHRGLHPGLWITTGNQVDVDLADAIASLAADPETEVIVAYAEGVTRGPALREALASSARAGKPVIFMKTGRSAAGRAAVESHTAALAGSDRIWSAVLRQGGAVRVRTFEELADAAYAATFPVRPAGPRLAILTISGGVGVLMADVAADMGLELPSPSPESRRELEEILPFAAAANPVDVTAQVFNDLSLIGRYLRVLLDDGRFDAVALFLTAVVGSEEVARPLIAELSEVMADFEGVPLAVSILASAEVTRLYEAAGFPVFPDPTRAVEAVAILGRIAALRAPDIKADVSAEAPAADALEVPQRPLTEHESMEVLESWGVPCVRRRLARSEDEAVRAGRAMGGKVALKISAPDILHKTDVGGVLLGVEGDDAVRRGYRALTERAAELRPDAGPGGVLVAQMVDEGIEAVVGVARDDTFGPVVMVGLGGVLVEVLDDVAFRAPPFGIEEARSMIAELEGHRLFTGFRGGPEHDVEALAALLSGISRFAAAQSEHLIGLDLNPVCVLPRGRGVVVLDAAITARPFGSAP